MKAALVTGFLMGSVAFCAIADSNVVVQSFGANGVLTWDAPAVGRYTVEWAPAATGGWSASWAPLADMVAGNGRHTSAVPMFYRVGASRSELLMHGNGTNGSTVFVDETGHDVVAFGNTQISTNSSMFGGASIAFDGSGAYLKLATNADWAFRTGDFTVDLWANFRSLPAKVHLIGSHQESVGTDWSILREFGELRFMIQNVPNVASSWTPETDRWYHIAIVRRTGQTILFVDGTILGSGSSATSISNRYALTIGASDTPSMYFDGFLDELRIVKGAALWATNFTPPTAEYPF